jgi:alpha-beta hydrolase superfamily lysophospholipase
MLFREPKSHVGGSGCCVGAGAAALDACRRQVSDAPNKTGRQKARAKEGRNMPGSEFRFRADDGVALLGRRWLPEGRPRAVVQIAHGLAEHSARYARLAGALNAAGYAVYANDHRGHGPSSAPADLGHFADADGWAKTVGDLWSFNRVIAAEQPGVPIVFLGHSLGSFLGRGFIAQHSDALAGAALSGSNGKPPAIATLGRLIARAERLRLGKRGKSQIIFQMWFGDFNKPFKPARTAFDWLSRDEKEVDAYIADPLCGFAFTTQLAIDVLDALPRVTSLESLARIRKDMPIYVFSGDRDPVGANIKGLIEALKASGFTRLTTRIYPDARHETLNETNRGEVMRDLIEWLDGAVPR